MKRMKKLIAVLLTATMALGCWQCYRKRRQQRRRRFR